MNRFKRVFITDCEGPISKNDNAFELTCHFVPEGEKFFTQISRYDDILAEVVKREGYKAGDTLRLIAPFLKAYGVTDSKMLEFSAQTILLMPGAEAMLQFLKEEMSSFIISTSYEHYIQALCRTLNFPFENTYCTRLDIDLYRMNVVERNKLEQLRKEICRMPLPEIPEGAKSLQDLPREDQLTIGRLDEIFWEEIVQMESGKVLQEVNPVGGLEKAKAAEEIVDRVRSDFSDVLYVGDSITDVECFRMIRENGGLTASFNGNRYAVHEAEIALLSPNAIITAVIADVFNRRGKTAVFNLIDNWEYQSLREHDVAPVLQLKIQRTFSEKLPKVCRVTKQNVRTLAAESSAFRRSVRGEKIGELG